MKICYIADAGSIHTQRWVTYFADKGHEVYLISPRPFGDNNIENVKLYILKRVRSQIRVISFPINLLSYIIRVRRLIRKVKPDILHAHYITDCGFWGALSGFHPFVLSAWGSDVLVNPRKPKIAKWIVKYTLKKADLITCDGENTKEEMVKLGAKRKKIRLIYFGVDTQKFSPKQRDEKLKEELQIFGSPVIISLRNLNPIYDVESLIRAIPLVLEEAPKAKFVIAGRGPEEAKLKDLAQSLDVSDSVRFVGCIPHNELPKYLASSAVYVSTSLSEGGIAVSTLEAMACGLPVVTTDVGDNKKWVEEGVNGFIVPLKAPESLAEKIVYLLQNEQIRMGFGQRNRKIIEQRNNYYEEMAKMDNIYEELIERCKS